MSWHESWPDLVRELRSGRGKPALVAGSRDSTAVQEAIGSRVAEVISIGQSVVASDTPDSVIDLIQPSRDSALLIEIEPLFAPQLQIDVVAYLRQLSQRCAMFVLWPGEIANGRLTYSRPGRSDHIDVPARDMVVLRQAETTFPDEVPYIVERYPA